ncbi:N,N-dimethylformamidase beta subunit family domain-containing protein [Microbacterium sp. DT81.1]|uniref:N,N-dimethylformamidase beta subunit family domain-containing protein n=1 Tax=Microbacterium sp. DT81.1 TaxID=3393413 RepID=UPI003CF20736
MLSGEGSVVVTISRMSSISDKIDYHFVEEFRVEATLQAVPAEPWRNGCGWTKTFSYKIPNETRTGIYVASCVDSKGTQCSIPFIVKGNRHKVGVVANVNTWLAYNAWGGKGKYDDAGAAAHVSFLRPNPNAGPQGAPHLLRGELWILGWLEREQITYEVLTDVDFADLENVPFNSSATGPQWKALIIGTHPEYWTLRMHDVLQRYLDQGGSLFYLGGNGIFENGEYTPDKTAMVFRAGIERGPREAAMFRLLNPPRHEREILGVATERSGAKGSPYIVEPGQAHHPLFQFTNLAEHARFGNFGLNNDTLPGGYSNGKASGWEVDTSDGPGAIGMPADSDLHPEIFPVPPSKLPTGLVVLARGEADGEGLGADMTTYNHAGGGLVFSAGSITFGGSLVVDPALRLIVLNALAQAGVQPRRRWVGADFTGDKKGDILYYYPPEDTWWLGAVSNSKLNWRLVGNTKAFGHAINDGRPFWVADFNGDQKSEVLFYYPGDDNWWLGSLVNGTLSWRLVGNTKDFGHNIQDGRPFWIADFDGSGRNSVMFYYPGDDNWWLGSLVNGTLSWSHLGTSA